MIIGQGEHVLCLIANNKFSIQQTNIHFMIMLCNSFDFIAQLNKEQSQQTLDVCDDGLVVSKYADHTMKLSGI